MSADLFQRLPTELVLEIAKDTADFVGIDSLLYTSKWVRDVISRNLLDITEELLASFPMTGNGSEPLFLIACLINEPGFNCSDLDDLQSQFTVLSLGNFSEKTIYRILRQGAHIQRLACACITKLRENLEIGLESVMDANWEKTLFPDWRQHMTVDTSWVEEFRVYRALWCLQILSDIYHASGSAVSQDGCGGWDWAPAERAKLPSFASSLCTEHSEPTKSNEPNCVAEALKSLGASCIIPSDGPVDSVGYQGWISPGYLTPIFESLQVEDLLRYPTWTPPTPPGKTMFGHPKKKALESVWGRSPVSLRGSLRTGLWLDLYEEQRRTRPDIRETCDARRQDPPLRNAKTLHRMGIFIWDNWRLFSVGLDKVSSNKAKFPAPDFSRWFEQTPQCAPYQESPLMKRWTALVETRI